MTRRRSSRRGRVAPRRAGRGADRRAVSQGVVVAPARAARLFARLRRRGLRIVFTNGVFDLLHAGHVRLLVAARALGDRLVVGVNSDASVRRLKGRGRPIVPLAERMEMLAGLTPVDYVVPFGEATPARIIAAVLPAVLVKGSDYRKSEIVGRATVEAAGGRVVRVRLRAGRSTSNLIARARKIVKRRGPRRRTDPRRRR
jgi:D-beta-D-heptose 7-phosphate kinase/D-beta-D-heptose 1-phosphate adenosyltransferase